MTQPPSRGIDGPEPNRRDATQFDAEPDVNPVRWRSLAGSAT